MVSHPIALAQCHKVLERLGAGAEEAINTAVGARLLADSGDRKKAAVASEAAAVANGLTILCRNVHDRADNATIFCIVARDAGEEAETETEADGTRHVEPPTCKSLPLRGRVGRGFTEVEPSSSNARSPLTPALSPTGRGRNRGEGLA